MGLMRVNRREVRSRGRSHVLRVHSVGEMNDKKDERDATFLDAPRLSLSLSLLTWLRPRRAFFLYFSFRSDPFCIVMLVLFSYVLNTQKEK